MSSTHLSNTKKKKIKNHLSQDNIFFKKDIFQAPIILKEKVFWYKRANCV